MRKPYFLLSLLVATTPARAALVIEPEPEPAYVPYATVSPVVAATAPHPSSTAISAAPAQWTSPQQPQTQPAVAPPASNAATQAAPAPAAQPGADTDQARKLLAQDAANVIRQSSDKAADATPNKPLVSTEAKPDNKPASTQPSDAASTKPSSTEPVAQASTEAVEVKSAIETEPLPSWQAASGTTLRQTVEGWSSKEGWGVRWESDELDYPIEQPFSMVGEYLDVITRTFELYKGARRPFKVEVYPSQKLVVVKEKK